MCCMVGLKMNLASSMCFFERNSQVVNVKGKKLPGGQVGVLAQESYGQY